MGESSSIFIERVSGKAVREARLGTNLDLAMFTWQENVRVMVVNTCTISLDTADEVLDKASCCPLGRLSVSSASVGKREQESEVKACADLRTRSARAQVIARELPVEGGTLTRGKAKRTTRRDNHTHTHTH